MGLRAYEFIGLRVTGYCSLDRVSVQVITK